MDVGGGVGGMVGRVVKQYWLIHTETNDDHNLKFIVLYSADLNKEGWHSHYINVWHLEVLCGDTLQLTDHVLSMNKNVNV